MKQPWIITLAACVGSVMTAATNAEFNNYAVIVSTSRYWFNYRHTINALSFYHYLKDIGGYPDDRIILMLADDYASNPRNVFPNHLYANGQGNPHHSSLYDASSIEIDYRGDDVNAEQLLRILEGRSYDSRLPVLDTTNNETRVLIYMTGHGGDSFLKFHDVHEIMAADLARSIATLHTQERYGEILFIADTCQAFTLGNAIASPNVYMIGSSLQGESSYAHHSDTDLGLAVIERYTHAVMQYLYRYSMDELSRQSLQQALIDPYSYEQQSAHIGGRAIYAHKTLSQVPVTDFFQYHDGSNDNNNNGKLDSWKGVSLSSTADNDNSFLTSMTSFVESLDAAPFAKTNNTNTTHHMDATTCLANKRSSIPTPMDPTRLPTPPARPWVAARDTSDPVYLACLWGSVVMLALLSRCT
jgi:GPI-anchor transamidase subunit K